MAKVTEKQIKVHVNMAEGYNRVEDMKAFISLRKLKQLGAKHRIYKDTKEIFYLIETDCELIF